MFYCSSITLHTLRYTAYFNSELRVSFYTLRCC